ncbi:hypothetical protein Cgig2_006754 [Carnegiea gigantea]|uniref:Agglutinin domain-containing protein n=1 Tax=Carnegiea gigantea TaxID=171969 RepID=A0A9Q1GQG9_9CARY|nr:hypothetical protein Cgig2_006754 [Carnegiea gigantea]
MATFVLPSLVCLKSVYNDKYLRYRYENVQTRGLLQFAGENVMDPYAQFEVEKAKTWAGLVHLKSRYSGHLIMTGSLHLLIPQTKTRAAGLAPCSSLSSSRIPMALKSSNCCTSSSAIAHAFRGVPPPLTLACLRDPRILTKTHATFWPSLIGNPSSGSLDMLPLRVTMASSWGPLCTMASLALDLHSVILRIPRWCNKSSQLRMERFS